MAKNNKTNFYIVIAAAVALGNLAVFGLMFTLMNYFELMGADKSYFDDGSLTNIGYINMITKFVGLNIDPESHPKISTLGYAICYGIALLSSGFAIFVANRRPKIEYEVTDAK